MQNHTPASIAALVQDESRKWDRAEPALEAVIDALKIFAGFELPEDYLAFLRLSNGGEGELVVQPYWFQIWPAEEVSVANRGYEVEEWYPGYFGVGSSGGGEMLAFRMGGNDLNVYMVPFIGGPEDALVATESFAALVASMGKECEE